MNGLNPIRVMIIDDHAVVRAGLSVFLATFDDMELVGEAQNGTEAVDLCNQLEPDIVLMDVILPDMDGAALIQTIRKACSHVQVLVLSDCREEDLVQGALGAGAIGYLLKDLSADKLAEAIRSAQAGRSTLAPEATEALLHIAVQPRKIGRNLTKREQQILPLLVRGLNNNQIARQLMISQSTVRFHISNILSKLNAHSRTEAAALAIKHHLVA